jgi:hypothetical protein
MSTICCSMRPCFPLNLYSQSARVIAIATDSNSEVPFLPVRDDFHPKRNQARQKLATLPKARFKDLSGDVYFELGRRYPEFREPEVRAIFDWCVTCACNVVGAGVMVFYTLRRKACPRQVRRLGTLMRGMNNVLITSDKLRWDRSFITQCIMSTSTQRNAYNQIVL